MATVLRQHRLLTVQLPSEKDMPAADERPPTPPPKDKPKPINSPPQRDIVTSPTSSDTDCYFPSNLSRTNSIYSLSRASFSNQISQLTSIQLPDASTLSTNISAIPTSTAAAKALSDAAKQIRQWIRKSSDVLGGLDAEDDVEWAAAAGREGLNEVDQAIKRFESLVDIYVTAIEKMQDREDIVNLAPEALAHIVENMETILCEWCDVKNRLKGVKEQVEIAMEWEELWNNVLGDIGKEVEALTRLVFEMEEKRHRSAIGGEAREPQKSLDIDTLETIVGETPKIRRQSTASNRFSFPPSFDQSPIESPNSPGAKEDSNLLALFARMQPLRASLDFLPMRLSVFHSRASSTFPTACEELVRRREALEAQWRKLESDAEVLRRELGEDRWILVFRNAGRQALKMCESVEKSLAKLREAVDDGGHLGDMSETSKRHESYEAKKMHYGPAIERILAIIKRGVKERLTVNGEILRLQSDMEKRWSTLQIEMGSMAFTMEPLSTRKGQQLRDSVSTIISTDRSVTSSFVGTPGSSPASSVVLTRTSSAQDPATPSVKTSHRQDSYGALSSAKPATARRYSSMPVGSADLSHVPRRTPISRPSSSGLHARGPSPSPSTRFSESLTLPHRPNHESVSSPDRPRWNSSTKTGSTFGHNSMHSSKPTPISYRNMTPSTRSASRAMADNGRPGSSPLSRIQTSSPYPTSHPLGPSFAPSHPFSPSQLKPPRQSAAQLRGPEQTPIASSRVTSQPVQSSTKHALSSLKPAGLKHRASLSNLATPTTNRRQSSIMAPASDLYTTAESPNDGDTPVRPRVARPQSVMGNSIVGSAKRVSMLPRPKSRIFSAGERDGRVAGNSEDSEMRWR